MEIKMVQCPNGHYYNAALHSSCPECGGAGLGRTEAIDAPEAAQPGKFPETIAIGSQQIGGFAPTVISVDPSEGVAEPVVGWLVCIEGRLRGEDFRLHAGYNYIGREAGDVHIRGDLQISAQNHAMVAYDSSDRVYYVGPSAGRNLIKVNGKTVLSAVELNDRDIISIGTTKLMFISLCGKSFGWDENGTADA